MSRVGKVPVTIPSGVTVEENSGVILVRGPKGELEVKLLPKVSVDISPEAVQVKAKGTDTAQQGLLRSLLANAVVGVSEGFEKKLRIEGVGYRAQVSGQTLKLELGFSHPIEYALPEGVEVKSEEGTITISGIDKQLVGQVAANIREFRKPEPYKGKGIRYEGEQIKRKAGKTAAGGATGAA